MTPLEFLNRLELYFRQRAEMSKLDARSIELKAAMTDFENKYDYQISAIDHVATEEEDTGLR